MTNSVIILVREKFYNDYIFIKDSYNKFYAQKKKVINRLNNKNC